MTADIKVGDLVWVLCGGVPTQSKVLFRYGGIISLDGFYDLLSVSIVSTNLDGVPQELKDKAIYYEEK